MMSEKLLLRPLDFQLVYHEDQQMWLLRDPLELVDFQIILSPAVAQMLTLMDGTLEPKELRATFVSNTGVHVDSEQFEEILDRLDQACLLENERSRQAKLASLEAYHALPYRPAALAGNGYPADREELANALDGFDAGESEETDPWRGRGIISPHIDYFRGGGVYSQVWWRAKAAAREADLVLIFGTDHNGSPGSVTLTRQPYRTPYGVLPTDFALVDALAGALDRDVFAEELHHRNEHSVELSAVWLHHVNGGEPVPMVPILCGSFHHFLMNGDRPENDPDLNTLIEVLREKTAGRKVLAVASVDLAHVGPTFGDNFTMDARRRSELTRSDESLIDAISQGDAARFFDEIASVKDRNRICGFSSIYLMLRFLGEAQGARIAYEHCPADTQNNSLVSICSLLLD